MNARQTGVRIRRLWLFTAPGVGRTYKVDFVSEDEQWRQISIIAGASQSGKTSTVEYVLYCLGAKNYPEHEEMLERVTSVALEVEINGFVHTIQRSTIGGPSSFASIRQAPLDNLSSAAEMRLTFDPPSDPDSISQSVLASFGLAGVKLPISPSKADSDTQMLSIRDVMRLIYYPNSRLDSQNLLEEHGNPIVAQKLQQTIDLIFGVADAELAQLADRIRASETAAREAERTSKMLKTIVEDEYPQGTAGVEILHENAVTRAREINLQIEILDRDQLAKQKATQDLRTELSQFEARVQEWDVRVRGRESLIERLRSLALQYADDKKKLAFLTEAERLFDPLHVSHCPACLTKLSASPHIDASGACSLCGHDNQEVQKHESGEDNQLAKRELAATKKRLDQLTAYIESLSKELRVLHSARADAAEQASEASGELNRVSSLPAPFLAYRDHLSSQKADAQRAAERHEQGIRLWEKVAKAEQEATLRAGQLAQLRKERKEQNVRPDRNAVVHELSKRFVEVLEDFEYPKLSNAFLDSKLIPTVRGVSYEKASSGGLTLISLAWAFAVWEIAFEREALAPGLLIIDSPQKNLGHRARPGDEDFADARLVSNVYEHVQRWLETAGAGAQVIFVDNSPPASVDKHVVVRFSGRADQPPFGLIDDATT